MKILTHIDTPKEWQITNDWNSHLPLLWLAMYKIPDNTVFEFGMGEGSTPLLKKYAKRLISVEENDIWRNKFIEDYKSLNIEDDKASYEMTSKGNHSVFKDGHFIRSRIKNPNIYPNGTDILFVDNAPAEERISVIEDLKNVSEIIIVHDTEESADYVYHFKDILNTFKYRLDFRPEGYPHTTAISNFINVEEWI